MDDEVRPTWKLAWGMWWRMFLITLGMTLVVGAIAFGVLVAMGLDPRPWLTCW